MKTIKTMKLILLSFLLLSFISCEQEDSEIVNSEIDTGGDTPPVVIEYDAIRVPPTIPEVDESDYDVYYVNSETGDDNNSGLSENAPIKTLAKAGVIARNPNTKILFKSGQVFKGLLWLGNLQSTESKPLIIDNYGGDERPTIDGEGSANSSAITLCDDNLRIRNIRITNKEGYQGIWANPLVAGAFKNIEITGCRIEEVNWFGDIDPLPMSPKNLDLESICPADRMIYTNGGISFVAKTPVDVGPSWFENIYITNNEFYKVSRQAVWLNTFWGKRPGLNWGYNDYVNDYEGWYPSKNVVVQGNDISFVGGSAIILIATKNSFMDHNKVYHSGYLAREGSGSAGIWPHSSINTTMQYNEVGYQHREHGAGDGQGLDVDIACSNTLVQYNYVHHCGAGGLLICNQESDGTIGNHRNTIVRNNVFYDNGQDGNGYGSFFTTSSGVKNVEFYNNLIVSTDRLKDMPFIAAVNWLKVAKNQNFTFKNNVFASTTPVQAKFNLDDAENWTFDNNLYYQMGSQPATLGDNHFFDYDPLLNIPGVIDGFENGLNFKLQADGIYTDGVLIDGMAGEDIEGNNAEGIEYLGPFSK